MEAIKLPEIPADSVEDFLLGFLAQLPNNETIPDSEFLDDRTKQIPKYTDEEWVQFQMKKYAQGIYEAGKKRLANKAIVFKKNIFER